MRLPTKDDVTLYTVDEAQALLPEVARRVGELREAVEEHRFAQGQVADLEKRWPEAVQGDGELAGEHERLKRQVRVARTTIDEHVAWFQARGIEIKDPLLGLVDFYAERDDGELVYLCWQDGEEDLVAWHTLTGGFQGRRALDEL
ncbi:MAG: DUF2203 domain-containing protein [Candidatus Thermoplasmatota archaeon]|nr:DUF2203 domain-containing protein [Candidatus Thermoplasmatota archaeon]